MVGRQAVLQPHLHLQRRLVVRRPELPTHPPTVSLLAMPARSPARTISHTIHPLLPPPHPHSVPLPPIPARPPAPPLYHPIPSLLLPPLSDRLLERTDHTPLGQLLTY